MPDYKPNPVVRAIAVIALVAAFLLVIVVIATSGGGSDGDSKGTTVEKTSRKGQKALEKGVWIVHEGDTLLKISDATGIDVDELSRLNPELDPQLLTQGQRIALR
jgi:LysM repeat protein